MGILNDFIYYVQSLKLLQELQKLLLLAPLLASDIFVSVVFLKVHKDNLRGLIRVCRVSCS